MKGRLNKFITKGNLLNEFGSKNEGDGNVENINNHVMKLCDM